ncbi:hypothetical protein DVH24_027060 [Malus domestica]|uniref:Uncharacterized protein n=1 Tax=Malus domestica TaxID=3750 RepID=A0A498IRR6_MALDO|nr:hypothetical protein DVH24_027060 [Malus domestica]
MSFLYVNNCLARQEAIVAEFDEPVVENESDHDMMMKLYAFVMTEYDDRLMVVEQCNEKLREGKKLMDDAKKEHKPQVEAIKLKDQALEKYQDEVKHEDDASAEEQTQQGEATG